MFLFGSFVGCNLIQPSRCYVIRGVNYLWILVLSSAPREDALLRRKTIVAKIPRTIYSNKGYDDFISENAAHEKRVDECKTGMGKNARQGSAAAASTATTTVVSTAAAAAAGSTTTAAAAPAPTHARAAAAAPSTAGPAAAAPSTGDSEILDVGICQRGCSNLLRRASAAAGVAWFQNYIAAVLHPKVEDIESICPCTTNGNCLLHALSEMQTASTTFIEDIRKKLPQNAMATVFGENWEQSRDEVVTEDERDKLGWLDQDPFSHVPCMYHPPSIGIDTLCRNKSVEETSPGIFFCEEHGAKNLDKCSEFILRRGHVHSRLELLYQTQYLSVCTIPLMDLDFSTVVWQTTGAGLSIYRCHRGEVGVFIKPHALKVVHVVFRDGSVLLNTKAALVVPKPLRTGDKPNHFDTFTLEKKYAEHFFKDPDEPGMEEEDEVEMEDGAAVAADGDLIGQEERKTYPADAGALEPGSPLDDWGQGDNESASVDDDDGDSVAPRGSASAAGGVSDEVGAAGMGENSQVRKVNITTWLQFCLLVCAGTATGNGPQYTGGAGAAEMGDDIQMRVVAVAAVSYISKQQLLIRHTNHWLHRSPKNVHDIR